MSTEDTSAAAAATDTSAPPPAAPAPAPAGSLSLADVEKLFTSRLAAERAALQADFDRKQAEREAALRAEFGKKPPKPAAKPEPAAEAAPPVDEKPWTKDPEYLAQQTAQREAAAKLADIEKTLTEEKAARRRAEKKAEESAIQQSVINELIDVDNPVRADASVAKTAAELLILRGLVVKSDTDKKLYVKTVGDDGQEKTVSLRDGVRAWLNGPEGARFRPALPTGAGSSPGAAYAPLSNLDTPLTEADLFKSALIKDQKLRASGAN